MNEETTPEVVETPKSKLSRKVLILTGAAVGLILAGGLAVLKTQKPEEETETIVVDVPVE